MNEPDPLLDAYRLIVELTNEYQKRLTMEQLTTTVYEDEMFERADAIKMKLRKAVINGP